MSLTSQSPKSTTAINSTFIINVPEIGIVGHKVQGFSADEAFGMDEVTTLESYIGVDGQLNAGYIPQLQSMRIMLAPTSPSLTIFNAIFYEMKKREEVIWIQSAEILLPSVKQAFSLTNGALKGFIPITPTKKTLQPVSVRIDWSNVVQTTNG